VQHSHATQPKFLFACQGTMHRVWSYWLEDLRWSNVVNISYWLKFGGDFPLELSCHAMCSAKSVSYSNLIFWGVTCCLWWGISVVCTSLLSTSAFVLKLIPYSVIRSPECRLSFPRQGRGTGGGLAICLLSKNYEQIVK